MAKIWVVLQQREGQIARMSWEAIAAAQKLAAELGGGKAEAVLLGAGLGDAAAEVAKRDLAAVHLADAPALGTYTPGAYVAALAPAIRAAAPISSSSPTATSRSTTSPGWRRRWGRGSSPR